MTLSEVSAGTLKVDDGVYRALFAPRWGKTAWRMMAKNCWERGVAVVESVGKFEKILKVVDASLQMVRAVDPDCGSGVEKAHRCTKDARDYLTLGKCMSGFWNFTGSVRNVAVISQSLRTEEPALLNRGGPFAPERPPSYSERLETKSEKWLGLASQLLGVVATGALTVGFTLKNIIFAKKFHSGMSQRARRVASQMPLVMFINHIVGLFKDIVDWFLEKVTYQRACYALPWRSQQSGPDQAERVRERQKIDRMHTDSQVRSALTTAKHAFELAHDATLFTPTMPPVARAAVGLIVAVLDFVTMWIATA